MRHFVPKAARIAGWVLIVVIAVLSFVPPELRPETSAPHHIEHFAIFCALGFVSSLGNSRRPVFITIALVVFCGAVELAQLFIPGRHARLSDFIVDALAVAIGVAAASFVGRIKISSP
jgi:VanZ family protein